MTELQQLTPHITRLLIANATRSNIYVVREDGGDTLVDPGPIGTAPTILGLDRIGTLRLSRVVLTHAHPAHAGSAARVTRGTGVSAWVHDEDAPYVDGRLPPLLPRGARGRLLEQVGRLVDLCPPLYRRESLIPGRPIGDLMPVFVPGHTPGHSVFLHVRDRALITGDALIVDGQDLALPEDELSVEPERARRSLYALAGLDFDAILPGHGPPLLRDARAALRRLLDAL